jgi:hypothetical protein
MEDAIMRQVFRSSEAGATVKTEACEKARDIKENATTKIVVESILPLRAGRGSRLRAEG